HAVHELKATHCFSIAGDVFEPGSKPLAHLTSIPEDRLGGTLQMSRKIFRSGLLFFQPRTVAGN
ncbi:hypothetical protein, partial [Escherichia coli]|uniref:hypothetical protein n=1 Tax=Escherichia coli TaxID=562 RepID=UPI001EDB45DA